MRITSQRGSVRLVALGAALALALAACGDDDGGDGGTDAPTDAGPVPGIVDEPCENAPTGSNDRCVYLGSVTDLTGVFQGAGTMIAAAVEDFWDAVNAAGGINGYDIDVRTYVEDTGYDVAAHAAAYERIEPNVFALAQSLGTNHTVGVLDAMEADEMVAFAATLWSGWEFEDNTVQFGPNYCIEAINAVDWNVENHDVTSVMSVHLPGDYGGDGAAGTAIGAAGNEIEELPGHQFADVDQAVQAILTAQPDLVVLSITPDTAASVIGGAVANGYTGRFTGLVPVDSTPLIAKVFLGDDDPDNDGLADALGTSTFIMGGGQFDSASPGHQAMQAAVAAHETQPRATNEFYTLGWAAAYTLQAMLEDVLAMDNPTRAALLASNEGLTVDYQGMAPSKTFGGDPNTNVLRSVTIGEFDAEAAMGLAAIESDYTGPSAEAHEFTAPCVEVS